ncbi:hypothetical protein [Nitrincola sp.]|uniref:hypothetical protein n=1 Tax=Nitrincola sp. TaxID=1926584 RepID=UPI003A90B099
MQNLLHALDAIEPLIGVCAGFMSKPPQATPQLLDQKPLITRIVTAMETNVALFPEAWLEQSGKKRGIINDHPEWAMLILTPASQGYDRGIFWQHVGIVIGCSVLQRERHQEQIGSEISLACLCLRQIGEGKKELSLLNNVVTDISLKEFHQQHLMDDGALSGIELLVRRILEHSGKTREGGGGRTSRQVDLEVISIDDGDDEFEGPQGEMRILESIGDEHTQSRMRSLGLHPKETQTIRSVSFTEKKSSPTLGFDFADLIRRQDRQVKHISQSNQRSPYRYSSLSRIELAEVARAGFELFTGRERFAHRGEHEIYAGLLLLMMLWLGRPLEQLLAMRVYTNQSMLPKQRKGVLAFLREEEAFVLPIPSPDTRNSLKDDAKRLLYNVGNSSPSLVDDSLIVASPVNIKQYIEKLELPRNKRTQYSELFPEKQRDNIVKSMGRALSRINRTRRMRITPLRISQTLFDEISKQSGDWVDAYLLTGHAFTITEVAAHYYSVSADVLEKYYHCAVVALRNSVYEYLGVREQNYYEFYQGVINQGDHGSKLNVKSELIIQLVKHLKHQLRAARRLPAGEESYRQIHNCYVAYIAFWILFATGYRAVNDLIFRLREIDFDTGFLVISDKDDEMLSQSRVIWLLPELRDQIRRYVEHLSVLQTLLYRHSSLYEHFEDVLSEPESNTPLMFFISDSWQLQKLSPENLKHQVPEFTLPVNASRHYLRSAMRAEGVHGELVNAFMGHAQQGQEQFGSFSTLTPTELFSVLEPTLQKFRLDAGWTVQLGLADGHLG